MTTAHSTLHLNLVCAIGDRGRVEKEVVDRLNRVEPVVSVELMSRYSSDKSGVTWVVLTRRVVDHSPLDFAHLMEIARMPEVRVAVLDALQLALPGIAEQRIVRGSARYIASAMYESAIKGVPPTSLSNTSLRPRSLVGREGESQLLEGYMSSPSIRLVVVTGIGGQGKTALVRTAMESSSLPAAWIDLSDVESFQQLVAKAQRSLGSVVDGEPDTLVLANSNARGQVLFDNFETVFSSELLRSRCDFLIESLLSRTLLNVILISRINPTRIVARNLENSATIRLKGLSSAAVATLLADLSLEVEPQVATELMKWSGGTPLYLKILAGTAISRGAGSGELLSLAHEIPPDISELLDQQIAALGSPVGDLLSLVCWHVGRVSYQELLSEFRHLPGARSQMEVLLASNLVELADDGTTLLVHPVVRESFVEKIISQYAGELSGSYSMHLIDTLQICKSSASLAAEEVYLERAHLVIEKARGLGIQGARSLTEVLNRLCEDLRLDTLPGRYGPGNLVTLARVAGISFSDLRLGSLSFYRADFRGLDLRSACLTNCEFYECEFSDEFGPVTACACASLGSDRVWVVGTFEGDVRVWDASGRLLSSIPVANHWISAIAEVSGGRVAVTSVDGSVHVVDLRSSESSQLFKLESGQIRCGEAWRDQIVIAATDGGIYSIDANTGLHKLLHKTRYRMKFVAIDPAGNLFCGGDGHELTRIESLVQEPVQVESFPTAGAWLRAGSFVSSSRIIVADDDGTITDWRLDADGKWRVWNNVTHGTRVWSVCNVPSCECVLSAGSDGTIRFWTTRDELRQVNVLRAHSSWVRDLALSDDGAEVGSAGEDQRFSCWKLSDGSASFTKRGYSRRVFGVRFDDANNLFVAVGDHRVVRFDTPSYDHQTSFRGHRDQVFGLEVDAGMVASGSDCGDLVVYDVDGKIVLEKREAHRGWIGSLTVDTRRGLVITGGDDRYTKVVYLRSGLSGPERETHKGRVSGLMLWGEFLFACGEDGTVRKLLMKDLTEVSVWRNDGRPLYAICLVSGGLVTAGSPGLLHFLNYDLAEQRDAVDAGAPIWSISHNLGTGELALGLDDGRVVVVDRCGEVHEGARHAMPTWTVAWSGTGTLLASGSDDSSIFILSTGSLDLRRLEPESMYNGLDIRGSVGASDGELAVLAHLGALT